MWLANTTSEEPLPQNYTLYTSFEVYFTENIATVNKPDWITDHTYSVIQLATQNDPALSHLFPYIQHWWPEIKEEIGNNLATFWSYRWGLAYTDGIFYKDNKIIIPDEMRYRMLEKIHWTHVWKNMSLIMPLTQCLGLHWDFAVAICNPRQLQVGLTSVISYSWLPQLLL